MEAELRVYFKYIKLSNYVQLGLPSWFNSQLAGVTSIVSRLASPVIAELLFRNLDQVTIIGIYGN